MTVMTIKINTEIIVSNCFSSDTVILYNIKLQGVSTIDIIAMIK